MVENVQIFNKMFNPAIVLVAILLLLINKPKIKMHNLSTKSLSTETTLFNSTVGLT